MVGFDSPSYDVDLERNPEMRKEQLVSEISHALRFKGHCILKLGMDEDLLEQASDEAIDLKRAGKMQPPPAQLIDALLGPEGTNEYCRLDELPEDEGDEDVEVGPELTKISQRLQQIAGAGITVCASDGLDNCAKSGDYLIRGGDYSDEIAELTEDTCTSWLSLLNRARFMLVYFFGEGRGQLELTPFDEDSQSVEIPTEPDMLVILRADQMHHKHQSSRGEFSIISWILAAEHSTTRGWTGGLSRTLGVAIPTARELIEWSQERIKDLVDMEDTEKFQTEVPREWQLMMRHSFFRNNHNPVAVRGEAGHMPTTNSNRVLWEVMNQGADFVTEVPYMRWDHELYYDEDPNCWMQSNCFRPWLITKTSIKHGQFIEGVDLFDNKFFGVSNMEAQGMDPMQRHILETSYEALYGAGYNKKLLMGKYIAVFTGCSNPEWNYIDKEAGACSGTGSSQAITSNRTSFLLGIQGPSTSIDCEQSSAGMALMLGCTAVSPNNERRTTSGGDSEAAICGGVFLQMSPFMWPRFNAYMNPKGRCFSFDQAANGYVRGECCASAALKPYAEKVDNQLLVVDAPCIGTLVGWRMTNNGRSAGLAAPSGPAEQEAIADCVRHAGISPLDVDAMECHAGGSLLHDGVEVASTTSVLRGLEGGDREMLTLCSSKPNVGVQQEACAMTAFLKVLYNISYANQAPVIHLKQLNPHIEIGEEVAVNFNSEAMAFRDSRVFHGFGTRGLGGTNINMVSWFSADGSRVPVVKPKMERASFSYWPAGGGMLESDIKASEGYFIIGTWTNWRTPEEMVRQRDGSFTATVTLGDGCVEAFQILLDGEKDKVLHPERPNALPGSRLLGPTMGYYLHGQNLNWVIDGREVTLPAVDDAISSLVPSSSAKQQLRSSKDALAHARDQGQAGDTYEVKLFISGKYRAVTWSKMT